MVIVPALADNVLLWMRVLEGAAAETQACVYDRAGIGFGWSDPAPRWRRTPDLMAADLHALLTAAGVPPPYVLAGHSVGGIIARRFYARYPGVVAGMLLIDSSHEDQARRFAPQRTGGGVRPFTSPGQPAVGPDLARAGSPQNSAYCGASTPTPPARSHLSTLMRTAPSCSRRRSRTVVRELLTMTHTWGPPHALDPIPLTALTATKQPGSVKRVWTQMQDELAALSSDSKHVMAEEAGHYVHLDDPDLVVQAIRDLVRRCR